MTGFIQTWQYRSPEALLGIPYDEATDLWLCACMTFELATTHYLFDSTALEDQSDEGSADRALDALHLSMIEKVFGDTPGDWARMAANYESMHPHGELITSTDNKPQNVFELLTRFHFAPADAADLAEYLAPMLVILPSRRTRGSTEFKQQEAPCGYLHL
jgi:serine/threonine protein kinase